MECRGCGAELGNENLHVEFAAHDKTLIDLILKCDECGLVLNEFIDSKAMIQIN